jgi:hypothetical protein
MARLTAIVLALLALSAPAALAAGSVYGQVKHDFTQTGQVPLCRFSTAALEAALHEAPTYDVEYVGSLTDAIAAAIQAQADGACRGHARVAGGPGLGGGFGTPRAPGSVASGTGAGLPLPLAILLLGVALAVIVGLTAAVLRRLGLEAPGAAAARHSLAEAEFRLTGRWYEVLDRLRS